MTHPPNEGRGWTATMGERIADAPMSLACPASAEPGTPAAESSHADRGLQQALDAAVRDQMRPAALGLGILLAMLAASFPFLLPAPVVPTMVTIATAVSAVCFGVRLFLSYHVLPLGYVNPIAVGVAWLVLSTPLARLYLIGDSQGTTNFAAVAIAAGAFFLSSRWLAVALVPPSLAWLWIVSQAPVPTSRSLLALPLAISVFVHGIRSRMARHLERLRLAEQAQKASFEETLRERERLFRSLVENVSDLISVLSDDGRVLYQSPSIERLTGYTLEELAGRSVFDLVHPDDRAAATAVFERSLHGDGKAASVELRFRHSSGAWRILESVAERFVDAAGRVTVVASSRDVTERRQAEVQREALLAREQSARLEAQAANHAKDEFLATLSHELRTPLNAILGWAQLLRSDALDVGEAHAALETIEKSARAQAQLIADLLDVSRVIQGKLQLELAHCDPAAVIALAVEIVRPAATVKNIILDVRCQPTGAILADSSRLQQIIWNLLSNAIKFSPRGATVEVQLVDATSAVEIIVKDQGMGISSDFLPHVFERFRQADSSATRQYDGLGLGLAIVRHLAELHGGAVAASSPGEGLGSTFTVAIPYPPASALEAREACATRLESNPELLFCRERPLHGLRVLVVDDDLATRGFLNKSLSHYGAEVMTVGSAPEAIVAFERWKPSVLVSDVAMPGEDGYSLIRRVRALEAVTGARTPALALTAFAGADNERRLLAAGFQVHLPKPIELDRLAVTITRLCAFQR